MCPLLGDFPQSTWGGRILLFHILLLHRIYTVINSWVTLFKPPAISHSQTARWCSTRIQTKNRDIQKALDAFKTPWLPLQHENQRNLKDHNTNIVLPHGGRWRGGTSFRGSGGLMSPVSACLCFSPLNKKSLTIQSKDPARFNFLSINPEASLPFAGVVRNEKISSQFCKTSSN